MFEIDVAQLYFFSTVALLGAMVALLAGWRRMTRLLVTGEDGYELSHLVRQLLALLVGSQVCLCALSLVFWLIPEVLPRGVIGLVIQLTYAALIGYVAVRMWRLADREGR